MEPTNTPTMDITSLKFAEFLQEGLPFIDQWTPTDINNGGCGEFALLFAAELDRFKVPYVIYALFEDTKTLKDAKSLKVVKTLITSFKNYQVNGIIDENIGISHIVVCVEDTLFVDSSGIINQTVLDLYTRFEISKEQLQKLLPLDIWNNIFDKDCIPIMKCNLDKMFTHFNDFKMGVFKYPEQNEMEYTQATVKAKREAMISRGMKSMFNFT